MLKLVYDSHNVIGHALKRVYTASDKRGHNFQGTFGIAAQYSPRQLQMVSASGGSALPSVLTLGLCSVKLASDPALADICQEIIGKSLKSEWFWETLYSFEPGTGKKR